MSADGERDDDERAAQTGEGRPWSPLGALFGTVNATRRSVIASLLAAVGSVAGRKGFAASPFAAPANTISPDALGLQSAVPGQNFRVRVVRPNDFLYFEVEFVNIVPVGKPPTSMRRLDQRHAGYLVVHHQPQAVAEQAYQEFDPSQSAAMPSSDAGQSFPGTPEEAAALQTAQQSPDGKEPTPAPPNVAGARIAGESRVVFFMPGDISSFPFTLAQLLEAFATWQMSLDASAQPAPVDFILPPDLILKFMNPGLTTITIDQFKQIYNRLPLPGEALLAPSTSNKTIVQQAFPPPANQVSPSLNALGAGNTAPTVSTVPNLNLPPVPPHVPGPTVTALELPYRLIQSPLPQAGWVHETDPERANHNNRYELWHTRLGARSNDGTSVDDTAAMPVRAIWSPDYPVTPPVPPPFTMALDGRDRQMLVALMAGYGAQTGNIFNTAGRTKFVPKPAIARRLMLSALGGWLVEDGDWDSRPVGVDLTQWNHRAAMARDYYVRVVYAGYLFPFGHAASLVKVTERKFEDRSDGQGRVAVLRQRFFIVVRQKTKVYQQPTQAYQGRDLPFSRIDCVTVTTPDIAPPHSDIEPNPVLAREVFWPMVADGQYPGASADFKFQMIGYDHLGRAIPFATPAMFISENRNNPAALAAIHAYYNAENVATNGAHRRAPPLNGAMMKIAPDNDAPADDGGDTNAPVDQVAFIGADPIATVPASSTDTNPAQFFPGTDLLKVRLSAVQKILGTNNPVAAKISDAFKGADPAGTPPGFNPAANPGQVFLDLVNAAPALPAGTPSDKGGGLLTPGLTPQSLSRTLGAVAAKVASDVPGQISDFAKGNFDPKQFLPDMKLLGVLPISDIIGAILPGLDSVPKLINQELPDKVVATFTISQDKLQPYPAGDDALFIPDAPADDGGAQTSVLTIVSTVEVPRPPVSVTGGQPDVAPPTPVATINGSLTNFKINLFGCIVISFDDITFSGKAGQKPDINIGINPDHGILFKGPLEFVNQLKDFLPSNGFSDPPNLSVTPAGITASYSLALPSVTLGVMTLQNISIGAGFDLPFDGNPPTARFNFAEKENPFNLTVSLFGGGGFLAIEVSAAGVQTIEAQLEFGAYASIDIGVASGSVYIKGGFHFYWSDPQHLVELDAFVELGGHLSILGLISVSLVFHVDLSYQEITEPKSSQLIGQATLTVEVDVLFFSKSVSVSVQKQFAGSSRDPKFVDFIPDADTWTDYCEAFAA